MGYSSLDVKDLQKMNNGQIINRMLRLLSGNYKSDPTFRREMINLIERLR
tara:strand:- start:457 stop:606 length:150 start_codon:yes stop_codon:yes gene_type:complete